MAYASSANADGQLPPGARRLLLTFTSIHNVTAPATSRMLVKLAGSMCVCRNAIRHSTELAANASNANRAAPAARFISGPALSDAHHTVEDHGQQHDHESRFDPH